ncbi:MAG: MFS transporter [Thermotogota bacterium]
MNKIELKLKKNIAKNYWYSLITNLNFTHGLWMLYLAHKGLSLFEIGMMEGFFHICSLLMEVPTGAIADLLGRKASRIAGRIVSLISLLILIFSNTFWMFALSFFFSALSYNLESGSGEALVFDSMKVINKEKGYTKVAGNVEAIYQTASIFSLIIGGILGQRSFTLAFTSAIVVSVIAVISAMTFYEPPIEKVVNSEHSAKNFLIHTLESFKTLFSKKIIASLTLFTTTLSAFSTVIFYYIQNYWKSTGLNISTIGIYLAIGSAAGALLSINVQRIESFLKRKKFNNVTKYPFLFFSLIIFLGIFLLAFSGFNPIHSVLSVIALTFIMAGESGMFVSFQNFLHQNIPSHQRATIISIESMLFSIIMIAIFPIFGWIADISSFKASFILLSVIAGIFLFVALIIMHRFSEKRGK